MDATIVVVYLAVGAAEAIDTEAVVAPRGIFTGRAIFTPAAHGRRALVYIQFAVFASPTSRANTSVSARHVLAGCAVVTLVVCAVVNVFLAVRAFESNVALAD